MFPVCTAFSQNATDSIETINKIIVTDTSKEFITYQKNKNYINPFGPVMYIGFEVPRQMNVKLSIFDNTGTLVCEGLNQTLNPGKYEIEISNLIKCKSGIYFYKFESDDTTFIKKLILLK